MTDQDYIRNANRPTISLVLSIFKGENFVVKEGGSRVFLRARCGDLQPDKALESGYVLLTPATTDPEFNSQLAWSISRRQLKELRSNRSVIKVTCVLIDEKNGLEREVGYSVMHIKDAVASPKASGNCRAVDVDPSKAKTYLLLGTKKEWQTLQPKLHMILQLEDLETEETKNTVLKSIHNKPPSMSPMIPSNDDSETVGIPVVNAAKLSETKMHQQEDAPGRFIWTVQEKDGYFQLGSPVPNDDLYVLNTTVISASYLHTLWDGKSPRKQNKEYYWQIKYSAYGCEIASEPFLLGSEDFSRRTFIGDKATARIRASGGLFFEYLEETSLEFHVVRYQLGENNELTNEEIMGFCYVTLQQLGEPDCRELKLCMDVVSEWGTSKALSAHEKPEVRVMFTLEVIPNYFSLENSEDLISGGREVAPPEQHEPEININNNLVSKNDREIINTQTNNSKMVGGSESYLAAVVPRDEGAEDVPDSAADVNVDISNTSNARRLLQFEGENQENLDTNDSLGTYTSSSPPRKLNGKQNGFTAPTQKFLTEDMSESGDSESGENNANLAKLMPEFGQYSVDIELEKFWLKSSKLLENTFFLSYLHRPIGIQKPVSCTAQPLSTEFTNPRQDFIPANNVFAKTVNIQKYSESLINEPLTVEFRKVDGADLKCFATAMIPFGRIFCEKECDNLRVFTETADILKTNNNAKIGTLYYEIRLHRDTNSAATRQSAFFPTEASNGQDYLFQVPLPSSSKNNLEDVKHIDRETKKMREWTRTQDEISRKKKEEKETAYLKILSEEAAKRDAERETVMCRKLRDLEKKEKECNRQKRLVDEKEERLNKLEMEVKDKLRELSLQQENLEHHADLNRHKLEGHHKIELDALNRQVRGYQDEIEKLKTKLLLLESKIETKDAEIDNLIDLKREQPDSRLKERVSSLEQENKMLRNQLKECNAKKEQYKKQVFALSQKITRLQAERDQEMQDLNENLRLQILATKEHKELKKERKAVHEISRTIKALRKEKIPKTGPRNGEGDQLELEYSSPVGRSNRSSTSAKDEEILRLQAERNRLLSTGAYTQFDMVVKELEKKMITLSQE